MDDMTLIVKHQIITVLRVIGLLLILEGCFMSLSLIPSLVYGQNDFFPLMLSTLITVAAGLICRLPKIRKEIDIDRRMGIFIVAVIWIVMTFFGAMPYVFGGYIPNVVDAIFETVSGFTTTGATIVADVEALPKGILFWRSLTHWIGGVGIVVIVISFIPFLGGGGMALFSAESAGPSKTKISPHIRTTGKIICSIYAGLTVVCTMVYFICGMDFFDALCHAFSTLASGGFSTKNMSAAAFGPLLQYMMILFMIPAGTNFILIYYCFKGDFSKIRKSEEFRVYMLIILFAAILIFGWTYTDAQGIEVSLRHALFQTVSFLTSTGFVSVDYSKWAVPAIWILILLMISGAMSGSTTGGLKIVRVILLYKNARKMIKQGIHSNAFLPIKLDSKVVHDTVINNVMGMFLMWILLMLVIIFFLIYFGMDMEEAIGATLTCSSNMGLALGDYGGFGTFAPINDACKMLLSIAMYLGRLEIVTVFVLFMPSFWRK